MRQPADNTSLGFSACPIASDFAAFTRSAEENSSKKSSMTFTLLSNHGPNPVAPAALTEAVRRPQKVIPPSIILRIF